MVHHQSDRGTGFLTNFFGVDIVVGHTPVVTGVPLTTKVFQCPVMDTPRSHHGRRYVFIALLGRW